MAVLTNLSLPPIASKAAESNGMNAPVDCSEAAQVLPVFNTSGAWPKVTAVWLRVWRSFQPMTSRFTLMPVWS